MRLSQLACVVFGAVAMAGAQARELTIDQRVEAERAIEQVFWNHRIWPKENRGAKPPLSAVLPDAVLRARVEDDLRVSNALDVWWSRRVTPQQLQAEIDRISASTHDPEMLREIYAALGNDPFVIAETLGRQTLVHRLVRAWYASDDRIHGAQRRTAEQAIAGGPAVPAMKSLGGAYAERTIVRRRDDARHRSADALLANDDEWQRWRTELARRFGTNADLLPVGRVSALEESPEGFTVVAVLSLGDDVMRIASVTWAKRPFDAWWAGEGPKLSAAVLSSDASYALHIPAGPACTDDTWQQHYAVPVARSGQSAVWTGTEMIIWGGVFSGYLTYFDTGGRYNPATDSWSATRTGGAPAARSQHTAVWTGTEMIVWGGTNGQNLSSGGRYNPSTDSWTPVSMGLNNPEARVRHTAVWTGSEMIVWGGYDGMYLNTGGRYNPSTDLWVATGGLGAPPSARQSHTAVWTGSAMIVWGGYNDAYLSTGARFNPITGAWTATAGGAAPASRSGHTAVWTGSEMIVWGGTNATNLFNTGGRYNPSTNVWTATSLTSPPFARSLHSAVWSGSEMIVWGGQGSSSNLNSGGRYNPSTNAWAATSIGANVPTARNSQNAVWTGSEMIVWSGDGSNTGGRYSPATDSWVRTSTGDGPSDRQGHTAIWTGTEMIVWGGEPVVSSGLLQTGGRYAPATDAWTLTPTAGAPAAREQHSAVWTGTEMIVWGGSTLNTGGRYDPTANSWTPTSTGPGVPLQRRVHTAVWTGSEMIVWGGSNGSLYLNSGGRYRPATDSWTPTSIGAGVPPPRDTQTAVWSGTEMIVWGGYDGGEVQTGGRYSPSADRWSPTDVVQAPSPRDSHIAVWTGTEMIVWGGFEGGMTNTGGRYDPATDTWKETSAGGDVPIPREYHAGVWTGLEMIVWGGRKFAPFITPPTDTGGRYDPVLDTWTPTSLGEHLPAAKQFLTAVWTGHQMLVWGGEPADVNVGLYCASTCETSTFHRDFDGDGYGDPGVTQQTCAAPPGYVADATDCNDHDPSIHPGATEACNGVDDDCNTVIDDNAAPAEIASVSSAKSSDTATFSWPVVLGAASYDVLRGRIGDGPVGSNPGTESCLGNDLAGTSVDDGDALAPGEGHWYLVRADNACGTGGYGSGRVSSTCP